MPKWSTLLNSYLWHDLSARISEFLDGITLGELMMNNEVLDISERQNIELIVNNSFGNNNYASEKNDKADTVGMNAHL